MYTIKVEPWALLLHTAACLHNSETLRQGPALEALLTKIFVLKDLTVDRGKQEEEGKRPYTCFELCLYILRALRISAPQHGIYGNSRSSTITLRRSILMPV
jgi:hypothetical protein